MPWLKMYDGWRCLLLLKPSLVVPVLGTRVEPIARAGKFDYDTGESTMSLRHLHLEIFEPGICALVFCCHACLLVKSKLVSLKCRWNCLATHGAILLGFRFSLYVIAFLVAGAIAYKHSVSWCLAAMLFIVLPFIPSQVSQGLG